MFEYKPHFLPTSIVVVGCGGTGSRLVPMLAQLVRTTMREFNPLGWNQSLPIYLVDDDVVEEKNLLRQNFIASDVGRHKAVVLAERYSRAFGIPIHAAVTKIVRKDTSWKLSFESCNNPDFTKMILVLAVDSPQARREILSATFRKGESVFVVDAGNEDSFGQVKFFTNTILVNGSLQNFVIPKLIPKPVPVNYIPYNPKYYEDLGTSVAERSCADLDQTLAINSMMATIMVGVIQNFLYVKPFTYNQISYSLNGAITTTYNTFAFWQECVKEPKAFYGDYSTLEKFYYVHENAVTRISEDLQKMGLTLNKSTGECLAVAKPVKPVAETEGKPKRKSRKRGDVESSETGALLEADIDFWADIDF